MRKRPPAFGHESISNFDIRICFEFRIRISDLGRRLWLRESRNHANGASRFNRAIECVGEIPRGHASRQLPSVWQRNAPVSPATRFNLSVRELSRGSTTQIKRSMQRHRAEITEDSKSLTCKPNSMSHNQCIVADDPSLSTRRYRAGFCRIHWIKIITRNKMRHRLL